MTRKKTKKKVTAANPTAAQADPSFEDDFGEDDELNKVEDFVPTESFDGLPLNQVPGKQRKFLKQ